MKAKLNDTSRDITWKGLLKWFLIVSAANGIVRPFIQPLSTPPVEQFLFYAGFAVSHFLMPAILIIPLHLIGKRINPTKGDGPKKKVAVWGTVFSALMLVVVAVKVLTGPN